MPAILEIAPSATGLAESGCAIDTVPGAWEATQAVLERAAPDAVVCVTGSFYVAGEVRAEWAKLHPEAGDDA